MSSVLWMLLITTPALFALSSCSSHSESSKEPRPHYFLDAIGPTSSYSSVFESHTIEKRVHSEFEPVMTGFVTFWDRELREAYVNERTRQFRLTADEEAELAKEQIQEDGAYFVFIFSAATREPSWSDFERKTSMWRITLETPDGSKRLLPERVETISQKDETLRYFYQNMSSFTKTYRVRFLRDPLKDEGKIWFRVTGTKGSLIFKFDNSARPFSRTVDTTVPDNKKFFPAPKKKVAGDSDQESPSPDRASENAE